MSVLGVEREEGFATVTLARPDALNALSAELRAAIARAFRELAEDESVRALILTGQGRAFCAGLDLKELSEGGGGSRSTGAVTERDMIGAVRGFPGPVIAAVNGFAITGGFELALACDFIVASSEARFADTHARVGILPGWGLSQKLPRLIGMGRAKELAFTGNFIDAEQALAWGLVNRVTAPDELLEACRGLAHDMLSCDPRSLRGYKQLIDAGFERSYGEALELEARTSAEHMRGVSAQDISARREAVQHRGRSQKAD
ncbi:MAG: enoyl-CoA hydratase [Myxococcota bacterium]|nr:enoyl-CoA hydratase [Myxococcota bacterium]